MGKSLRPLIATRLALAAVSSVSLTACASFTQAVTDRAIMSDDLLGDGNWNKVKSMTGDRRLVRVVRVDPKLEAPLDGGNYIICPEPFSGAIIARSPKSGLTVTAYGSAEDAITQTAAAVDQRADVVRLYQDARFDWCMARASGDVGRADYIEHLKTLQTKAFEALKKPEASKPDGKKDEKKDEKKGK